ncbi:hypothetical protein ONE63_001609 [Megalurothrips usitatus]|uniref:Chromo domain-containing protein n=1 Tax=Megalurothrips usitatus TaxID=439358 RepID=A0AAV7XJZ3_9NEOP|nr:hypothetical protein ONE63_001609 [Megalurothrips usitatus]
MGVKDLWQLLAPVCERKSLWELQDKAVAIDLSGWVCDSQNITENSSQPNMHLRNLFFRTSCLLLIGARPVFVLEGDAPDLKLNVMSQRNASRGFKPSSQNSGKRSRYKGIQKKCQEMLKSMGVHCVQSPGEAEALCALLNAKGIVDGCISQDSDCFLYGGKVVYRNFTISSSSGGGGGAGFSIDMYRMERVEELLGLSRTKLIGLSLLCGCDYNQGVSGVGKETAVKFLSTLEDSEVFSRFSNWRRDAAYDQLEKERTCGVCDRCCHLGKKRVHDRSGCELCGTSKSCHTNNDPAAHASSDEQKLIIIELNIRKKALQNEDFPSQDVIDEFSCVREVPEHIPLEWLQPNLISFMKLADKHLKWDECYSVEKFLPLLTRWIISQRKSTANCPIYPESILKTRVLKGVASYEVKWADREGLFETLVTEEGSTACLTIEPKEMFERAFPRLVLEFNEKEAAKKNAKKKGKSKTTKAVGALHIAHECPSCGKNLPSKNQKCLCHFLTTSVAKEKEKEVKSSASGTLEDLLDRLSLNSAGSTNENKPLKTKSKSSKIADNCEKLKRLLGNDSFDLPESKVNEKNVFVAQSRSPLPAVKDSEKCSFEHLLDDEKWTIDDFAEDEGDLSDIVQTITGKRISARVSEELEACSTPPRKTSDIDALGTPKDFNQHQDEDPFEEDAIYTPLIERVRRMRENNAKDRRTSAVSSLKIRRFSESFDAFCLGDNATSSPVASAEDKSCDYGTLPNVTFSLGITNLLEDSK